jgi:hypothetical protein
MGTFLGAPPEYTLVGIIVFSTTILVGLWIMFVVARRIYRRWFGPVVVRSNTEEEKTVTGNTTSEVTWSEDAERHWEDKQAREQAKNMGYFDDN